MKVLKSRNHLTQNLTSKLQNSTTISSLEKLSNYSTEFKDFLLKQSNTYKNQIILLKATMGSGKTTFTRSLVQNFDPHLKVTSPTFIGYHLYQSDEFDFYHYDLYQVALSLEEFQEILDSDKKKIIFFEWSENLDKESKEGFINDETSVHELKIDVLDNEDRVFTLKS